MRLAPLVVVVVVAGCSPDPVHVRTGVSVLMKSDDPAAAEVTASADVFTFVDEGYDIRDPATVDNPRLELDGEAIPLTIDRPGHLVLEPRTGFPGTVVVAVDGATVELPHADLFQVTFDRQETYLRVVIDPPAGDGEGVSITQYRMNGAPPRSEPLPAGGSKVDFEPTYARFVIQRVVATDDNGGDPTIGGSVRVAREVYPPCWVGDPCP